jgi:putative flippase GtrA
MEEVKNDTTQNTQVPADQPQQAGGLKVNFKDIAVAMLAGFIISILLWPILKANAQESKYIALAFDNFLVFVTIFTAASGAGMVVAYVLAHIKRVFLQLARFVLVGGMNTILDLSLLTLIIYFVRYSKAAQGGEFLYNIFENVADPAQGLNYTIAKGLTFLVAVVNSYFWNKYWTFKQTETKEAGTELVKFFTVTAVGFGVNVGLATLISSVGPLGGLSTVQWAQVSALSATMISMVWNFIGYKLIVFKK